VPSQVSRLQSEKHCKGMEVITSRCMSDPSKALNDITAHIGTKVEVIVCLIFWNNTYSLHNTSICLKLMTSGRYHECAA